MKNTYTLHGWHLSYYTGKVLCYLRYKGIPFEGPRASAWTLLHQIKRRFGAAVMPVVVTPQGEWLQDSGEIIARLEQRFAQPSITPDDAVVRFASNVMEAWGDEWWVPVAMHTRWSFAENYAIFEQQAGAQLLPGWPAFLQRQVAARIANGLRAMLHGAGVRPAQAAALEQWSCNMLDLLDAHFATSPYLFGNAPLLGDFGLVGTMYGHLGRDPWPAREWIRPRVHLRAWIDRMAQGQPAALPTTSTASSPTLDPIFAALFAGFTPYIAQINAQVQQALAASRSAPASTEAASSASTSTSTSAGKLLRRSLDDIALHTPFGLIERKALPFAVWKAQGVLRCFSAMSAADQARVRAWAAPLGGTDFLALKLVPLERSGLRVRAASL